MIRRTVLAVVAGTAMAVAAVAPSLAETTAEEMREHPRIAKAINDLEDAIRYLEAAPHDFGGHKAKAIADSKQAVSQLRQAIKYRVRVENSKKK